MIKDFFKPTKDKIILMGVFLIIFFNPFILLNDCFTDSCMDYVPKWKPISLPILDLPIIFDENCNKEILERYKIGYLCKKCENVGLGGCREGCRASCNVLWISYIYNLIWKYILVCLIASGFNYFRKNKDAITGENKNFEN